MIESGDLEALQEVIPLPELSEDVLSRIFSFMPPKEEKNICSTCKRWRGIWEKYRYQESLERVFSFSERIENKTLIQCLNEFSPILHSRTPPLTQAYPEAKAVMKKIHCMTGCAFSFLTPLEKKTIKTIQVEFSPSGLWERLTAYVSTYFGKIEPLFVKRKFWEVVENPLLLKSVVEIAFRNRDLYLLFQKNVFFGDIPLGEKVEKIREWIEKNAKHSHSLDSVDGDLTQIPEEIGAFTQVETLDLSRNRITSLPSALGTLSNLETLRLSQNRLTSFLEDCSSLQKLRALHLEQNLFEDLPEGMKDLQLMTLDISFNPLKRFPSVLFKMERLQLLRLSQDQRDMFDKEINQLRRKSASHLPSIQVIKQE